METPFALPLNLHNWIEDHRKFLKPPVANRLVFAEQGFFVMVVGGPNARKDFHVNAGAEFFYQLEGAMVLRTYVAGRIIDVPIRAGEIFLLPALVPHSPQRTGDGVGLVIERRRNEGEKDGLQWYCERCCALLYQEFFVLNNIETDFPPVFDRFFASRAHRTCRECNAVMENPAEAAGAAGPRVRGV